MSKKLGILGGMGPLATVDLFKKVVMMTNATCDQEHIHQIIDNNSQIPDRTLHILGQGEDPTPHLVESAKRLESMGAEFIIMPCNTAHYFYDRIVGNIRIPFLNMVESTAQFILDELGDGSKVGLLATDGTCQSGVYDKCFASSGVNLLKPDKSSQRLVMDFIYGIKEGKDISARMIYNAMEGLKEQGVEVFILGCTELSYAMDEYGLEGNFVDPLSIVAKKAVEFAFENKSS
ncbi:aspartate racemase [Peptoclostridium litorale DSM 5388]|uniref:Aspartate racemase n=1 Tax=Peptoclostridium litorale DSM 5388 TaxID=1121324 RepID=A0A069RI05_PEPLI|nr:amino acid racemase [Peptoclostridium litorale]KDR95790.1 aspartate racemase [Peptoclostridium litorale DSM 5388]SIO21273.1 aspartate racemase [Peptoclostridium litorale DSM 5388]